MFRSSWIIIRQFSWYNTRYWIVFLMWIHISNYIFACNNDYRRGLDWWIDLLRPYTISSYLQAIQFTVHRYTRTSVPSLHYSHPGNGIKTVSLCLNLLITHQAFTGWLLILLQLLISRVYLQSTSDSILIFVVSVVLRFISILLTLLNSQFQFSNLLLATNKLSLYRLGTDHAENTCHVSDYKFIGPLPALGVAVTT
jgi:hypothetical protein